MFQVTLLLENLASDPRSQVQDEVLNDLKVLAEEETAHLWTKENIENLVDYIRFDQFKDSVILFFNLRFSLSTSEFCQNFVGT